VKSTRGLLVALALISVLGVSIGAYTFLHRAVSEQVYVYDCGIVDYKPTTMTQYCADAGVGVANIKWESWSDKGATGTGDYAANNCEPSCVAGTWKYAKVDITLSKPVKDKGKTVLSRIDLQTQDPKELLPLLKTSSEGWDLEANSLNG